MLNDNILEKHKKDSKALTWFVHDGQGTTLYDGLTEDRAREISARYPDTSIGWESLLFPEGVGGAVKLVTEVNVYGFQKRKELFDDDGIYIESVELE